MRRDSRRDRRRVEDRKQRQLCEQVGEAIDLTLGESGNPLLQGCWVVDVRPAPDQSRLRVRVQTADAVHVETFLEHLRKATPWLRSEVASFISRRRVPEIVLEWVGPEV